MIKEDLFGVTKLNIKIYHTIYQIWIKILSIKTRLEIKDQKQQNNHITTSVIKSIIHLMK